MFDEHEFDASLVRGLAGRLALVERALAAAPGAPDQAFLRRVGQAALRCIRDAHAATQATADEPRPVELGDVVRRALRLVEPTLLACGVQVVLETQGPGVRALLREGPLLRLVALLVDSACRAVGAPLRTLTLSLGDDRSGPWVLIAPSAAAAPVDLVMPAEAASLTAVLGAKLERVAPGGGAATSFRLALPASRETSSVLVRMKLQPAQAAVPVAAPTAAPEALPAPLAMPMGRETAAGSEAPAVRDAAALAEAQAVASEALAEFFSERVAPRRVLVVDDEEALLALFAAALPTVGIDFELASSASAALALVKPDHFSLAIIDKNLPDRSGLDLVRSLLEIDPGIGAVLITGYTSAQSVSAALELGVYDYLDKPFPDLSTLLARLDLALQRHALHARASRLAERLAGLAEVLPEKAGDPRLASLRALLSPAASAQPLRVATLLAPSLLEYLTDPLAPVADARLVPVADAAALHARLDHAAERPDMIVVEPSAYAGAVSELVARAHAGNAPAMQVLVITRDESLAPAMEALQAGIADYLLVREITPDALRRRLRRALQRLRLQRRDRAVLMELLGVDIDRIAPTPQTGLSAADLAAFEPTTGSP